MSLNFFDHRYCFDTKSSILVELCSFFVAMLYYSYNWLWNEKIGPSEPFWTSSYLFPKKVSELFPSPNIVLVTESSILVQLCSFLLDRLHFGHYGGWNEKIGLSELFWTSFQLFPKSIRARWVLTFSITEHCFGHQIVNFSPIVLIFGG